MWIAAAMVLVSFAPFAPSQAGGAAAEPLAPVRVLAAAAAHGVEFGVPFELTVVHAPELRFDAAVLAPLRLEAIAVETSAERVERRFRARAFALGELTFAVTPPLSIVVRSCLPQPNGALEWPSDGYELELPARGRWWWWVLVALVLTTGAFVALRRRASAAPTALPASPPSVPWSAAAALAQLDPDAADVSAAVFCARLKAIVRRHCSVAHGLDAEVRTSEELLDRLPAAAGLRPCLAMVDAVLFGAAPASAAERSALRAAALAFVQATGRGDESAR